MKDDNVIIFSIGESIPENDLCIFWPFDLLVNSSKYELIKDLGRSFELFAFVSLTTSRKKLHSGL